MASPSTIVFCGTSPFAVPSLRALAADPHFRITHVITQPDRPVGRKQVMNPPAIKVAAIELGLPVFQPERLNREFDVFKKTIERPDALVVISYGQLLSQAVLDFPTWMPLPRWRGASPLQHTILAGDREGGVTIQQMALQLDAGPILLQESMSIADRETTLTLHDRLATMGADLLLRALKERPTPKDQDERHITLCGKLSRADGIVDPKTETAEEIDRKVRALTPWPSVTMQNVKILETALEPRDTSFALECAGGSQLHLVTVQPAGKKPMAGADWGRGKK
jgi:methionyl-tRNA formyltransferase